MKKPKADYRLQIIKEGDEKSYLTRSNGRVCYFNGSEQSLALSNLAHEQAALLRFELDDALEGHAAAEAVRACLKEWWKRNPAKCPLVVVL